MNMKKTALLFSLLLFSLNAAADPNRNGNGNGRDNGRHNGWQQRSPQNQQQRNQRPPQQQQPQQRPNYPQQQNGWQNNGHYNDGRHNGWQNNGQRYNNRYVTPPPRPVYPNRIYTPIYRNPVGARPQGYVWYNGNWCPPPRIRYDYNTILWAKLLGVIAHYSYQVPAPARWACVVSMNGYVVSIGHGLNPTEAQYIALLNCDQGGYNCAQNYYAMDCAPR